MLGLSDPDIRYTNGISMRRPITSSLNKKRITEEFIQRFLEAYPFHTYKELGKMFGLKQAESYAIVRRLRSHGYLLPRRKKTFEGKVDEIISKMKKK